MKNAFFILMALLMSAPVFANEATPNYDDQELELNLSNEVLPEEATVDDYVYRRYLCYSRPYNRRGPVFRGIHPLRFQAIQKSLRSCQMGTRTRCVLMSCRLIM